MRKLLRIAAAGNYWRIWVGKVRPAELCAIWSVLCQDEDGLRQQVRQGLKVALVLNASWLPSMLPAMISIGGETSPDGKHGSCMPAHPSSTQCTQCEPEFQRQWDLLNRGSRLPKAPTFQSPKFLSNRRLPPLSPTAVQIGFGGYSEALSKLQVSL